MIAGAPAPLQRLVAELSKLPGVGEKTALRLALFILRSPDGYPGALAQSIQTLVERVRLCSICCSLTEEDPCVLCRDPRREGGVVCVVEGVADLMAVERTQGYRGRYHVLHGALSPLEGIGPEQLRIKELLIRLGPNQGPPAIEEVIVATNPNLEGEATATYLSRLLHTLEISVTRLASGLPVGGDLEYADEVTLGRAFEGRRSI